MDYAQASIELARLIRSSHFSYLEEAGLAIQVFADSLEDGDTPAMALALAKNINSSELENAREAFVIGEVRP